MAVPEGRTTTPDARAGVGIAGAEPALSPHARVPLARRVSGIVTQVRVEAGLVGCLSALMFAESAMVAFHQPVWSPIDEGAHWATAVAVIHGHFLRPDQPIYIPSTLPPWPSGQDYQAGEPPLNYVGLGLADVVARRVFSTLTVATGHAYSGDWMSVRAMRLTNSLFFAMLVPLLWLCARVIAPGNLALARGLPAASLVFPGIVMESTRAGTDVLVAVLATLGIYLFLRWRTALTLKRALVIGLVVGLATLSKYHGVYAFIPIGLVLLARIVKYGLPELQRAVAFIVPAVAAWAAVITPWFAFQYGRYGDPTAGSVVKSVLPHWVWLPADPKPLIAQAPYHIFISSMKGETDNPLAHQDLFLNMLGTAVLVLAALGLFALGLGSTSGGTSRLERLALGLATPGMLLLLVLMSIQSGISIMWNGRYQIPAILPIALLLAAGPAFLLPVRWRSGAGLAFVLVAAVVALYVTFMLTQTWPAYPSS